MTMQVAFLILILFAFIFTGDKAAAAGDQYLGWKQGQRIPGTCTEGVLLHLPLSAGKQPILKVL